MRTTIFAAIAVSSVVLMGAYKTVQNPQKAAPTMKAGSVIETLDGPTLFSTYCAVCHGPNAKGDGPMAKLMIPKTADLTQIAMRHGGKFPRTQIDAIIAGETDVPGHGTRDMPVWGPIFSKVQRDMDMGKVRVDNVARYLESIQEK